MNQSRSCAMSNLKTNSQGVVRVMISGVTPNYLCWDFPPLLPVFSGPPTGLPLVIWRPQTGLTEKIDLGVQGDKSSRIYLDLHTAEIILAISLAIQKVATNCHEQKSRSRASSEISHRHQRKMWRTFSENIASFPFNTLEEWLQEISRKFRTNSTSLATARVSHKARNLRKK